MVRPHRALLCTVVCLCAAVSATRPASGQATGTVPDSIRVADTTDVGAIRLLTQPRRSRFAITSGKTYNRIEGLAVHLGPVFSDTVGSLLLGIDLFGILR